MDEFLMKSLVAAAARSDDPLEYWADVIGVISAFAQEHIGPDLASLLLREMAESIDGETEH